MAKINVIYGSTTGTAEAVAAKIADALDATAVNVNAADASALDADVLVLGSSTWGFGDLQDDWAAAGIALLEGADLSGKKVAVFGVGDSQGFADTFCDAPAIIAEKAVERGATLVGALPLDVFPGLASKIVSGDHLVGLPLDETNEPDKSDERIAKFVEAVKAAL